MLHNLQVGTENITISMKIILDMGKNASEAENKGFK